MFDTKSKQIAELKEKLEAVRERSNLLDEACGIGLWEAVLHNGDALHPKTRFAWSPEFRRLIGFDTEEDFPNLVNSWSDRLHPDDVSATFAAFAKHLEDKTGSVRYSVNYRLKVRDGSYKWFRATGGCVHQADGTTIRACGSLTDVNEEMILREATVREAESDRVTVDALAEALSELAQGNMTYRITKDFSAKTASLRSDFNETASKLQQILKAVSVVASSMLSGSKEISAASEDLSRRTVQQAASLEETAAALEEITGTVKKTAAGAQEVSGVTTLVRLAAEKSGIIVDNAVSAMTQIEQSSNEISQIIGVIDEIAFQTNLLALNAGVEAARAGDAGKGFAVVAQEVRELAQRSAAAAKSIKSLISTSSQQVGSGVELVGQTGIALREIVGQIGNISGLVGEIASSTHEQSTGLHHINIAVNQIDQLTQQNAAMVEETTASGYALANEANELQQIIDRFRLNDQISSSRIRYGQAANEDVRRRR
ncbi:PAS domain-containing protein [Agrobacterium genomosp. 3 str. RTP8]|uniref:methyl-accepting chemotaxis protein n=1 Tax=Agrobacterium tomkonis TaxID=1183410 RepID=UPI003D7FF4B1|nr:PAS domain-containing protein [Agrobacterium tomkonis RTP8]